MKKKLLVIGSIVIAIIVIGIILFFLLNDNSGGVKPSKFRLDNLEKIGMCKEVKDCPISDESVFADISFDTDIKVLNDAINDINEDTKNYKEKMLKSNFNSSLCEGYDENYLYRLKVSSQYNFYSNDKYISVAVVRNTLDVCTYVTSGIKPKLAIYDKVNNKMLNQKEFKQSLGVTDEMVYKIINDNIDMLNEAENNNINKKKEYDYVLFYNTLGELTIGYYLDAYQNYLVAKMIV